MTRSKGRTYNDDQMVELIAMGVHGDSEIARQLGVNRRTVWQIRHGQSRPDLQDRIDQAVNACLREIRRHAIGNLEALIDKQIQVAFADEGETARKCRDFVINLFLTGMPLAPDRKTKTNRTGSMEFVHSLPELSSKLKDRIFEELDLQRPNYDEGLRC